MAWITLKPSGLGNAYFAMKCGAELPQADHHKPPYVCLPCTPTSSAAAATHTSEE